MDTPENPEKQIELELGIPVGTNQRSEQCTEDTSNNTSADTVTGDLFEHALSN